MSYFYLVGHRPSHEAIRNEHPANRQISGLLRNPNDGYRGHRSPPLKSNLDESSPPPTTTFQECYTWQQSDWIV
jgi:hypothetical protein